MPTSSTVLATADLQFHAQGAGYVYPNGSTIAEQQKLGTLLRVCGDIGTIFNVLMPKERRAWWKDGDKTQLKFTMKDGKITIAEIIEKVQQKLDDMPVTNGMIRDAESKLPHDIAIHMDPSGNRYPARVPPNAPKDETAMAFGVVAPVTGGRTYYGKPDGTIICCTLLNLTNLTGGTTKGPPVMLMDKTVPDGRIDVILAVHFEIPSA